MPSFDIVSEVNQVEVRNAVDQANKEIGTRFDFKGSSARVDWVEKAHELTLTADSDFQLGQVRDLLLARMSKRGVDFRFLDLDAEPRRIGGDRLEQVLTVRSGIDSETARRIQGLVKASKLKVQAAIQGDTVRISGAKRDDLQAAIALLRREIGELPLAYQNFRD